MVFDNINSTSNRTSFVVPKPVHEWHDYVQAGLLLSIVAIGIPVNILALVRTLITCRRCKSVRTCHMIILKIHLAVVDILVLLFYAASRAIWVIAMKWSGGDFLCKFLKFFQNFVLCCNTNLLAVVAIDRLLTVRHVRRMPDRKSWRRFQKMINVAYAIALALSVPQMYVWETIAPWPSEPDWAQCVTVWASARIQKYYDALQVKMNVTVAEETKYVNGSFATNNNDTVLSSSEPMKYYSLETLEKVYIVLNMFLCFNIPFVIVTVSYAMVCLRFRRSIEETHQDLILENRRRTSLMASSIKRHSSTASNGRRPTNEISVTSLMELLIVLRAPQIMENVESPLPSRSLATLVRAKNTVIRTSAYIVLAYVILWAPYNALGFISLIYPIPVTSILKLFYEMIALNAVVNPFIYGL